MLLVTTPLEPRPVDHSLTHLVTPLPSRLPYVTTDLRENYLFAYRHERKYAKKKTNRKTFVRFTTNTAIVQAHEIDRCYRQRFRNRNGRLCKCRTTRVPDIQLCAQLLTQRIAMALQSVYKRVSQFEIRFEPAPNRPE